GRGGAGGLALGVLGRGVGGGRDLDVPVGGDIHHDGAARLHHGAGLDAAGHHAARSVGAVVHHHEAAGHKAPALQLPDGPLLGKADGVGHLDHLRALADDQPDGGVVPFGDGGAGGRLLGQDGAGGGAVAVGLGDVEQVDAGILAVVLDLGVAHPNKVRHIVDGHGAGGAVRLGGGGRGLS